MKSGMIIPLKSVIMMIGPSGCGKSTFIKNQLVPKLQNIVPDANIQILCSDDYRREILGKNLDKTDERMKYASEGAFKLMDAKFEAVTTWPISADFVILDATFIGRQNREKFVNKAKDAQYQLTGFIFDFNDREEYFKYITNIEHRQLISEHLKKFHKELGDIGRKDFDYFYKIKSKDYNLQLEKDRSYDLMKLAKLPNDKSYFIVGDLHGCLKEFKELLNTVGFEINENENRIEGNDGTFILLTGDIVDKGDEVSELIDFISINLDRIKICIGGHDNSLLRYVDKKDNEEIEITKVNAEAQAKTNAEAPAKANAEIQNEDIAKKLEKYFDSAKKLSPDALLKFKEIMKNQSHFYIHDNFVLTHAPCENKYIGKFDKFSIRKQRNDSYPHYDDYASNDEYISAMREHYSFISREAKKYQPYHFFGHISLNNYLVIDNKVFLDTGCVYGNKLTGVFLDKYGYRMKFKSVQSNYPKDPYIVSEAISGIFRNIRNNEIKFQSLEFEDKIDVLEFAKNKINFISGTMSPCGSNIENRTLEDMREAFSYYRHHNINKVILQKKYMGSRSNMYLFPKDIDKSYMVSRNGFVIRRLNLKDTIDKMLKFFILRNAKAHDKNNTKILNSDLVIIDGELMPWSALGKSLIESYFMTVGKGVESELQLLEDTCFEKYLDEFKRNYENSEYKKLRQEHKKEDIIKIMGESKYRQFSSFENIKLVPIKEQKDAINTYNKQIEIYGKEGELEFKPFAILKIVDGDKEELFFDCPNNLVFTMVSDDDYCIVPTDDIGLDNAREWFEKIAKEGYEGVVIKPLDKVYTPGIAPYIKVRNSNYLTIIYGYDYIIEPKFSNMLQSKNIRNKLIMSIREFEIGKRMLEIPYKQINENNSEYLDICTQMVVEEKKEKDLDPRL